MSHYVKSSKVIQSKKFCKVCFDAQKPESEYTSHYVKSTPGPTGIVICPTLLNAGCKYCKEPDHIINNCPVLKEKELRRKEWEQHQQMKHAAAADASSNQQDQGFQKDIEEEKPKQVITTSMTARGSFKILEDDDDDEETVVVPKQKQEQFPSLKTKQQVIVVVVPRTVLSKTFASMAAKSNETFQSEQLQKKREQDGGIIQLIPQKEKEKEKAIISDSESDTDIPQDETVAQRNARYKKEDEKEEFKQLQIIEGKQKVKEVKQVHYLLRNPTKWAAEESSDDEEVDNTFWN